MSGTPIQNSIEELWCLMDFIEPGKLGTLEVFKNEYCDQILACSRKKASPAQIEAAK